MRLRYSTPASLLMTLILVACAAEPPAQTNVTGAVDDTDKTICTREYPIGSNIPVTKCRTRDHMEANRESAAEGLRRAQAGGSTPVPAARN